MSRFMKWTRRLVLYPLAGAGVALAIDDRLNSQRVRRNMRALWTGVRILFEYKMRWDENSLNSDLHRRVATMILNTCQKNGGLYIKFGQGIASMNHILPKEYNQVFQVLHDNAPYVEYNKIRKIILDDLEVDPDLIFREFDHKPVASASIAQVHKAVLHNGDTVAVKVQKPYIADQVPWDLLCYRVLLHAFEYVFELPLVWSAEFTEKQMLKETDFMNEAMNGQKTKQLLNNDKRVFDYPNEYFVQRRRKNFLDWRNLKPNETLSEWSKENIDNTFDSDNGNTDINNINTNKFLDNKHLRNHVYIPRLYPQYCSKRILTAEWCDGVKCNNIEEISKMGFKFSNIMNTVISLFGYQIFVSGFVHCDPHPGNLLVRPHPRNNKDYQLVFLDHGLYIEEPNKFRKEYSIFWTSMFIQDIATLYKISEEWGISDVEFFASMQLIKPFSSKKGVQSVNTREKLTKYQIAKMQQAAKERVQTVLKHTRSIPRHLIFVGRNMNIVRANNKDLGSPVNRVAILGEYAARGASLVENMGRSYYWKFRLRMLGLNFYYNWKQIYDSMNQLLFGIETATFEDEIEEQMSSMAKEMGIVVDETMFDA